MDGLSATASVIAVIQLIGSIASILKDYYVGVKEARSEIQRLYRSISSLAAVLTVFHDLKLSSIPLDIENLLHWMLEDLTNIQSKLGDTPRTDRPARWSKSLEWPFQKPDIQKLVAGIQNNKSTLALHVTVQNL
jgi:hypothetical protein